MIYIKTAPVERCNQPQMKMITITIVLYLGFVGALHAMSKQDAVDIIAGIMAYPTICPDYKKLDKDHLASTHFFGLTQGVDTNVPEIQAKVAARALGYIDEIKNNNPQAVPTFCHDMERQLGEIHVRWKQLLRELRRQ